MNIIDKIQATFTHISKLEEKPNIYIKTKIVDANKGLTFNERVESLREFKQKRLKQLKNK